MHVSAFVLVLAISSSALAAPLNHKRALSCPATDDSGSALTSTGTDGENTVCDYQEARGCEYFTENGTFSSGASNCPKGLVSSSASSSTSTTSTVKASVSTVASKSTSSAETTTTTTATNKPNPNLSCPPTDLRNSKLTATGTDGENVVCTYQASGACEYFDENGTFSSGGSTCPKGLVFSSSTSTSSTTAASLKTSSSVTSSSSTSSAALAALSTDAVSTASLLVPSTPTSAASAGEPALSTLPIFTTTPLATGAVVSGAAPAPAAAETSPAAEALGPSGSATPTTNGNTPQQLDPTPTAISAGARAFVGRPSLALGSALVLSFVCLAL